MNAQDLINKLEAAVNARDKKAILDVYELNQNQTDVDWFEEPNHIAEEWDELVDKANQIIY